MAATLAASSSASSGSHMLGGVVLVGSGISLGKKSVTLAVALPGLRPGAPGRLAPGRAHIPEALTTEEWLKAEEELMRDISASTTKSSDVSRLRSIVKAISRLGPSGLTALANSLESTRSNAEA